MAPSSSRQTFFEFLENNVWWFFIFGPPALGGLCAYLAKWETTDLVILTSVLLGTGVVVTALYFWHRVRIVQAEAALKQAMLQRDLSPDEIERLLLANVTPPDPPRTDAQAIEELMECLAKASVPATTIEQVLKSLRELESPLKQVVCSAVVGLLRGSVGGVTTKEKIMAVVHGLTKPVRRSAQEVGQE